MHPIRTLLESLTILALAAGIGLTFNHFRVDGLSLTRDFWPDKPTRPSTPAEGTGGGTGPVQVGTTPVGVATLPAVGPVDLGGFAPVDVADLLEYLGFPEGVVVLDARSRSKYDEHHIPGARYLNYYQSEKLIEELAPALETAAFVVIYCDGGDCEDSVLLAEFLHMERGIDLTKIHIYVGGMKEWRTLGLPTVVGPDPGDVPEDLPMLPRDPVDPDPVPAPAPAPAPTPVDSGDPVPSASPPDHGLQVVSLDDARMYQDELADAAVFADARSRRKYEDGHIAGAHYLNHYQSEKLIEGVKPSLDAADFVIVYCDGGDCEDSINLASDLIQLHDVDFDKIYIFEGGYQEWQKAGLPIVVGANRE